MFTAMVFGVASIYGRGFLTVVEKEEEWFNIQAIIESFAAVEATAWPSMTSEPPTAEICPYRSLHPLTSTVIYCSNPSGRDRHGLCACHLRFHDTSRLLYKALEAKVGTSPQDLERAWGLRLAHGVCFFGGVDKDHRTYMLRIVRSHLTSLVFEGGSRDLWKLLPSTFSLPARLQYSFPIPAASEFHLLNSHSYSIFDNMSRGNTCAGHLGGLGHAWNAYFPQILLFDNDFFLFRLRQTCPFIYHVATRFLPAFEDPAPMPSSLPLDMLIIAFYHGLSLKLSQICPIGPSPPPPPPLLSRQWEVSEESWDDKIQELEKEITIAHVYGISGDGTMLGKSKMYNTEA